MTLSDFSKKITTSLQPLYDEREAAAIAKLYLQTRLQMPPYALALNGRELLSPQQLERFEADLERMANGCPVQYVLGETEFCAAIFEVTPDTLIPRPETEELVLRVVSDERLRQVACPRIWDVGTGSGCVAISTARMLPHAKLYATDISDAALQVAQRNAQKLIASVQFAHHDMRDIEQLPFGDMRFDGIVSNPPYIPLSVRKQMHVNVTAYEPATALFVPDDRPLIFYEALADLATKVLNPNGVCHMEIYEEFAQEMRNLFIERNFDEVEIFDDLNGRARGLRAVKRS